MLKQKRQFFEWMFVIADLLVVTLAWFLAYWLRFYSLLSDHLPPEGGIIPPFTNYLPMVLFIWLIWAFVFRRFGLYKAMRGVSSRREVWMLLNANSLSLLLFIAVTYLFREKEVPYSRLVFVIFGILAVFCTILERSSIRFFLRDIRRRGYNLRYLLLIGAGQVAGDIASRIRLRRELGIQLVGCLSKDGGEKRGPRGLPVLGSYLDLEQLLKTMEIDQVIVALPLEDLRLLPEIMAQCKDSLVDVKIVPDVFQFISLGGSIEEFEGMPVISVQESPLDGINLASKRIFDVLVSISLLILLSPLLVTVAALVKLTSRGPMFYKQERVNFNGQKFSILKFRTMCVEAEANGPGWSTPNDSRVTSIGRFLRKFSLDELPQLLNVLRGEMSIVGPRPERPVYIEQFRQHIPRYMLRHKVPAGMTGWAQVNGWRGDTSIDKRIEYDLYYIEHWSMLLDVKILWLTLTRSFTDRNAY